MRADQLDADYREQRKDAAAVAEAIGEALHEALEPFTREPLPWPIVDALGAVEDAEDWRWVHG